MGQEREMARIRSPGPDAGLRGSAAGDQGRPDGDLLGLKRRGNFGAEEFPHPISHSIWPHPLVARTLDIRTVDA